jgi:hypothetical protein
MGIVASSKAPVGKIRKDFSQYIRQCWKIKELEKQHLLISNQIAKNAYK